MAARRVFVIWTHALFHDALCRLLNRPGIELVGDSSDHSAALDQIAALQPDTVLVEEEETGNQSVATVKILDTGPADMRVIRVSLANNELEVYHRDRRTAGQTEDLISLIEHGQ